MRVAELLIAYVDGTHETRCYASDDDATEETWAESLSKGIYNGFLSLIQVNPHEPSDQHHQILNTKHVKGIAIIGLKTLDTDTEDPLV